MNPASGERVNGRDRAITHWPGPLRVAVIGFGQMGKHHVRVWDDMDRDVELVAVVDPLLPRSGRMWPRAEDMYATEQPDMVSIAVPTTEHYLATMLALSHGCHVLVEKPIAVSATQGELMALTAQRKGLMLTVGHIERFNPAVKQLMKVLPTLGRVYEVHATRLGPRPERISDVGVVFDLAPHDLDIMRLVTGSEPVSLYAAVEQRLSSAFEDQFVGVVRFEGGAVGVLDINWLTPVKQRRLTVTGEKGMFVLDYIAQELLFLAPEGGVVEIPVKRAEPLAEELLAFVTAVREGGPPPVTPTDAIKALVLAQTMIHAASNGGLAASLA